ncbi:peroxiredoxin [Leptolyngbya sp. FACHB-261]|uniref:peroxiredoxin family protein n=1 Tax=Leptolyngbya sp. FACHB-261 TaxID=2692806 RepID=UPI001687EE1A|nr:redoxin domain-containing protein [Leptolyngbya sp. FACHB-261]MBD2104533.1 redoxin domain-containing protein [Leptolyngbya sp. FACHB-261]
MVQALQTGLDTLKNAKLLSPKLRTRRLVNHLLPIPATPILRIGQIPPDFELPLIEPDPQPDSEPAKIRRSEFCKTHRFTVLSFTRIFSDEHYCPLCFPHQIALRDNIKQIRDLGAEVLMVAGIPSDQGRKVISDLHLNYPVLSDPNCGTFRLYHTGQALGAPLPATFILDNHGRLRYQYLFRFQEANPPINEILQTLISLQVP